MRTGDGIFWLFVVSFVCVLFILLIFGATEAFVVTEKENFLGISQNSTMQYSR